MNAPTNAAHLTNDPRYDASREIRAPRGTELHCKSWLTEADRKSTRLNSSHIQKSRMPSSA